MLNTQDVIVSIGEVLKNNQDDIDNLKYLNDFFEDIIKKEGLLKKVLPFIRGENGRIRRLRESSLHDTVLKEFPIPKVFADFENDPRSIHNDNNMSVRKAIILMFFIAYTYELTRSAIDDQYTSPYFGIMGFDDFIEQLDSILSKCKLPILYPASQFDWLILMCIRQFDLYSPGDTGETLIKFFNDVLLFSFPSDELSKG